MAKKTLIHHVRTLQEKPEHVRKRVAVMSAAGVTGVVAFTWAIALVASGSLSSAIPVSGALAAGTGEGLSQTTKDSGNNFQQLLGAAAAATGSTSTPPALTIVDNGSRSTLDSKTTTNTAASATIIPF